MAKLSLIAEKKIDQIEEIRVGFLSISRICVCGVFLSVSLNCTLIVWFNCTLSVCECLPNSTPHTFPIVSCGDNSSLGLAPELLQKSYLQKHLNFKLRVRQMYFSFKKLFSSRTFNFACANKRITVWKCHRSAVPQQEASHLASEMPCCCCILHKMSQV